MLYLRATRPACTVTRMSNPSERINSYLMLMRAVGVPSTDPLESVPEDIREDVRAALVPFDPQPPQE